MNEQFSSNQTRRKAYGLTENKKKIKRIALWALEKLLDLSVQELAKEKKVIKEGLNSTGEG